MSGEHTPRRRPHAVVREDRRRTRKRAAGARVGIPRDDSLAPTNTKRERERGRTRLALRSLPSTRLTLGRGVRAHHAVRLERNHPRLAGRALRATRAPRSRGTRTPPRAPGHLAWPGGSRAPGARAPGPPLPSSGRWPRHAGLNGVMIALVTLRARSQHRALPQRDAAPVAQVERTCKTPPR